MQDQHKTSFRSYPSTICIPAYAMIITTRWNTPMAHILLFPIQTPVWAERVAISLWLQRQNVVLTFQIQFL